MRRFAHRCSLFVACSLLALGCSQGGADREAPSEPRPEACANVVQQAAAQVPAAAPAVAQVATVNPDPELAKKYAPPAADKQTVSRAASDRLSVKRLVLATGVDRSDRQPTGVAQSFKKAELDKLYAFVELNNPGQATDVVVSFQPPESGAPRGRVELAVGSSPRWRTWAFSRAIDVPGEWQAIVSTSEGRELSRTPFQVEL